MVITAKGGQMNQLSDVGKLLLPVEDARHLLSLGRSKFYEEVRAGRIEIVKAGVKSLVPQRSLEHYVEQRITEARARRGMV